MLIVKTTDDKFLGEAIPDDAKVGDVIQLGDFMLEVQFLRTLDDGHVSVGNPNYQLTLEV